MLLHAYSIFDVKAQIWHAPFFMVADGAAARAFSDLANDASTTIGKHPADYTLHRVGSFDDNTGRLLSDQPVHIAHAVSLVQRQPALFDGPERSAANGSDAPAGLADFDQHQ